jgi:serine/threonine protein kinase
MHKSETVVTLPAAMATKAKGLPVGSILASRYQIRRELGRGGMGYVYLCRDLILDERVALKIMPRSKESGSGSKRRKKGRHDDAWFFYEEARALAGLSHPSIVRARDYGVLSDGAPYLVMDVVPGRSLHEWIYRARTEGLLPWPVVWTTIDQVLGGLSHAHARGVIHGDLKPSNILLHRPPGDDGPRAYILDLGLAWLTRDLVDHRLDGSREVAPTVRYGAGTPGWMAPEQIRMATPHIGPATDLYPLGCLLFTLLVGEEPFEGTNEELLEQHKRAPLPDFDLADGVPDGVRDFLKRLMAKWPWNRFDFTGDARIAWQEFKPEGSFPSMMPPPMASDPSRSGPYELISEVQTLPDTEEHDLGVHAVATPGLLGVRPSPFIARGPERKELMEMVRRVCTSEQAVHEMVLLSGPAGVGKSRLAEWLCQEVYEQALMLPLRARYRKIAAPLDGVVGALVQHYRVEKCKRATIEKVLMNVWSIAPDDDEGLTWVAGAAAWLNRQRDDNDTIGPTKKRFVLDRPELKWLVIRKTLEKTSRERAIVMWLDDLHRAPAETFQRLARLKRDLRHVPMLLVATMRNEDVANDPTARARIELLLEEYAGRRLELEPLDMKETEILLRETLPLGDRAVDIAARRAKGNPLFALQLLHSWAMRGDLRQEPNGFYAVHEDALVRPASTTAELWDERVDALPADLRPAALAASALGGDIRREVLEVLLRELGLDANRALNAMKRAQLLLPSGSDRLRWTHALLQEYLLQRLGEQPNADQVFRVAADALAHHPAAQSGRIVRHRVTNLLRATEVEQAAQLLHAHVAVAWGQVRDAAVTLRDLSLLDGHLGGIHLAHQLRWRAEALRHAGSLEEARRQAEIARRTFRDLADDTNEAHCLRLLGHIASDLGASAQGRRLATRALGLFRKQDNFLGQAQCEVLIGEIDYLVGEHARAFEVLDEAATKFQQMGDVLGHAQCLILQGFVEQSGGSPSRARELLAVSRANLERIGYRLGVAQCDLALAHADHRDGDFARAHERATATLKAFRLIENPRCEAGCERLLGMNALDSGHPNTAEVHARSAGVLYSRLNDPWGKVESLLLLAQVALYRADAEAAREQLIRCEAIALAEAEPKQHRHLTLAWLAASEGRFSDVVREIDAARRTFKDSTQSGDHTPQLLLQFEAMAWPDPAGPRVKQWLAAVTRR